ncbi:autotransporter domain-containing protein [Succinivibrio dextrinosolvens]|uniref:autotransporter domain-containing protein n=1 Tax=Succinivibrio dextrinosolvens TaxID=83771 RepID=UPI00247A43F8|nr:autotransporter domain-containing protein [Succinivibrio dextrinosolvens]
MNMLILNKGEDFTFEDYQKRRTSNDSFYLREKKNSFRLKPLTVAVSIVLTGLTFSNHVEALDPGIGFQSPWIVGKTATVNIKDDNQLNVTSPNEGAIAIIYGIVNFSDTRETWLYTNFKSGLTYNNDNSITVYGQINGSGNETISNLFGAYSTNQTYAFTIQSNNNTIIFKEGSGVNYVNVYGVKINNTYGSGDNPSSADSNTVIIEKGCNYIGNKYVVGGYAIAKNVVTANNNRIIIGSGNFSSAIVAGWTSTTGDSQQATMTGNEVYLYGDADVSGAEIYGGVRTVKDRLDQIQDLHNTTTVITGNTLIFGYNNTPWAPNNYTVGNIKNFSSIRLDTVTWGKTITISNLSNASTDSTITKINAENINFSGVEILSPGDSYDMLTVSNVAAESSIGLSSESSTFTIGSTLEGTASLKLQNNTVTYTVNGTETQPQTHTAAMTMSAGTVALTQGGDTLSAAGFNLANSGINGTQAFSAVGGGMARVNTGSHVNVNTLNFSVGVGNNIQNDYGQLSVGAAFEAGFGKFKNHFNAGKADPYIKKNGDIKYYGIAVLSNMAFENLWHVNGALRYGRIETSQNRAVYNFNTNQTYDVDLSSYYIGAELGGGKVIKLDDLNSLDLYGKYFFLHQDGNTFNAGGKYELSSVNSHRLRLAGRYSHNYTPTTALYTGLGAEYEFDGKSELKVDGFWAKPSKTDGIRGFGELGVTITPASNKGLIFDFGIKGLLGDGFRGAWANAEMKYLF